MHEPFLIPSFIYVYPGCNQTKIQTRALDQVTRDPNQALLKLAAVSDQDQGST